MPGLCRTSVSRALTTQKRGRAQHYAITTETSRRKEALSSRTERKSRIRNFGKLSLAVVARDSGRRHIFLFVVANVHLAERSFTKMGGMSTVSKSTLHRQKLPTVFTLTKKKKKNLHPQKDSELVSYLLVS